MRRQLAAWSAVHDTRTAVGVLCVALLASSGLGAVSLRQLGPIAFLTPVSLSLLLPVVAGTAVAVACNHQARLLLPNPARTQIARAAWLLGWAGLALACTGTAVLRGNAMATPSAVARNTVLHVILAVTALVLGLEQVPWLASVLLTLTAILFGANREGTVETYHWWAVMLDPRTDGTQLVAVGGLFVLVLATYAVRAPHPR